MHPARPSVVSLANGVRSLLRVQRAFRRAAGSGLGGGTALQVLAALDASGPLRAVDLADQLGIDISGASRTLSGLQAAGLVERVRDQDDARNHPAALTAAGARALHESRDAVYREWSQALAGWSDEELETLAADLTRLVGDLEAAGVLRAPAPGAERGPEPSAGGADRRTPTSPDREDVLA